MFPLTPDQHHWLEVATEDEGWCSFTSCTPSRSRARTVCVCVCVCVCVDNLPRVVTRKWNGRESKVEPATSQLRVRSCLKLKPGFYSNARNARKASRREKYASKIKSAQVTQENYASKKRNDKIDSIFHATQAIACDACVWMETGPNRRTATPHQRDGIYVHENVTNQSNQLCHLHSRCSTLERTTWRLRCSAREALEDC